MSESMYREIIIEHSNHPQNYGEIKAPDLSAEKSNPLCGDRIKITIKLEKNKIKEIKFSGVGCSVSRAGGSVMTEQVKGKTLKQIEKYSDQDFLEDLAAPITPARQKCALLALKTLKKALQISK